MGGRLAHFAQADPVGFQARLASWRLIFALLLKKRFLIIEG